NSKIVSEITPMLNPTLHFKVGNFRSLPYRKITNPDVVGLIGSSTFHVDFSMEPAGLAIM
ncbi:hypothetical protein, partial [Thiolapillus sp.]